MAKKFLEPVDHTQLEILNVRMQQLSSPPGSPVSGQFWYNTTDARPQWYDGTANWEIYPTVSTNTPTTAVLRDSSGNFLAGTITANLTGTASQATLLYDGASTYQSGSYYLNFANSTGTRTHTAISDFDAQVQTSRLDQMAAPTAAVSMNSQNITNLATPVNATDAANKAYVDASAAGLDVKDSVRLLAATALAAYTRVGNVLTENVNGALANIDGVAPALNDRILLTAGASNVDNGIYVVTSLGGAGAPWVLTRSSDANTSAEVMSGMFTFTSEGTTYAGSGWILTTPNPITLNTTGLTFTQFSQAGTIIGANVGAGAGWYQGKVGTTLNFKSIIAASSRLSITVNTNDLTLDVVEANLVLNNIGGTLSATKGGTGLTTTTQNGVLIGGATNTFVMTAAGTANQVFAVPSGGGAPVFGAINLASSAAVSGVLPIANGGTNSSTALTGSGGVAVVTGAGGGIIQGPSGTTTQVLHGNAGGLPTFGAVALATDVSGQLPVANGGTGASTKPAGFDALSPMTTLGDIIYFSTTGARLAGNTTATKNFLTQTGTGAISAAPVWGVITASDIASGIMTIAQGGTNSGTALAGSTIMISSGTGGAIVQGAAGTSVQVLHGNVSGAPTYGAVVLTSDVSGILPIANGGTNASTKAGAFDSLSPMNTLGDLIYFTSTGVRLAGNTSAVKQYLSQTGTGTVSAAPVWATLSASDIGSGTLPIGFGGTNSNTALTGVGSVMVNDGTKIIQGPAGSATTVLHGNASGTPTYAAVSLTADVSGILPIANGGTNASTKATAFDNLSPMTTLGDLIYGGTAGTNTRLAGNITATKNFLVQTGTGSASAAPTWGTIVAADLPATLTSNAKVNVLNNATAVGTELGINFIPGTNVTLGISDNPGQNRVDVTINAAVTGTVNKYSQTLSTSATSYTITHSLGTLDVMVIIYNTSTGEQVFCDVYNATTNTVTLNFAVAPTASLYRVVVVG